MYLLKYYFYCAQIKKVQYLLSLINQIRMQSLCTRKYHEVVLSICVSRNTVSERDTYSPQRHCNNALSRRTCGRMVVQRGDASVKSQKMIRGASTVTPGCVCIYMYTRSAVSHKIACDNTSRIQLSLQYSVTNK